MEINDPARLLKNIFVPNILLISSQKADEVLRKNGAHFNALDLFEPFAGILNECEENFDSQGSSLLESKRKSDKPCINIKFVSLNYYSKSLFPVKPVYSRPKDQKFVKIFDEISAERFKYHYSRDKIISSNQNSGEFRTQIEEFSIDKNLDLKKSTIPGIPDVSQSDQQDTGCFVEDSNTFETKLFKKSGSDFINEKYDGKTNNEFKEGESSNSESSYFPHESKIPESGEKDKINSGTLASKKSLESKIEKDREADLIESSSIENSNLSWGLSIDKDPYKEFNDSSSELTTESFPANKQEDSGESESPFVPKGVLTPWFEEYIYNYNNSLGATEWDFFNHPVACILLTSSSDPDALRTFDSLIDKKLSSLSVGMTSFIDIQSVMLHRLIIHDDSGDFSLSEGKDIYKLRKEFPKNSCSFLVINSSKERKTQSPWKIPVLQNLKNVKHIKRFIRKFIRESLIPFMIQSLSNSGKKLKDRKKIIQKISAIFTLENKNDLVFLPDSSGYYERRFADWHFMLGNYKIAHVAYIHHLTVCRTLSATPIALAHRAATLEMIAHCEYILGGKKKKNNKLFIEAYNFYVQSGRYHWGVRVILAHVIWNLFFHDASATNSLNQLILNSSDFCYSMFLQQRALSYILRPKSLIRHYSFDMAQAGVLFCKIKEFKLAIQCFLAASDYYENFSNHVYWSKINDFIRFRIMLLATHLNLVELSKDYIYRLMENNDMQPHEQLVILKQFIFIHLRKSQLSSSELLKIFSDTTRHFLRRLDVVYNNQTSTPNDLGKFVKYKAIVALKKVKKKIEVIRNDFSTNILGISNKKSISKSIATPKDLHEEYIDYAAVCDYEDYNYVNEQMLVPNREGTLDKAKSRLSIGPIDGTKEVGLEELNHRGLIGEEIQRNKRRGLFKERDKKIYRDEKIEISGKQLLDKKMSEIQTDEGGDSDSLNTKSKDTSESNTKILDDSCRISTSDSKKLNENVYQKKILFNKLRGESQFFKMNINIDGMRHQRNRMSWPVINNKEIFEMNDTLNSHYLESAGDIRKRTDKPKLDKDIYHSDILSKDFKSLINKSCGRDFLNDIGTKDVSKKNSWSLDGNSCECSEIKDSQSFKCPVPQVVRKVKLISDFNKRDPSWMELEDAIQEMMLPLEKRYIWRIGKKEKVGNYGLVGEEFKVELELYNPLKIFIHCFQMRIVFHLEPNDIKSEKIFKNDYYCYSEKKSYIRFASKEVKELQFGITSFVSGKIKIIGLEYILENQLLVQIDFDDTLELEILPSMAKLVVSFKGWPNFLIERQIFNTEIHFFNQGQCSLTQLSFAVNQSSIISLQNSHIVPINPCISGTSGFVIPLKKPLKPNSRLVIPLTFRARRTGYLKFVFYYMSDSTSAIKHRLEHVIKKIKTIRLFNLDCKIIDEPKLLGKYQFKCIIEPNPAIYKRLQGISSKSNKDRLVHKNDIVTFSDRDSNLDSGIEEYSSHGYTYDDFLLESFQVYIEKFIINSQFWKIELICNKNIKNEVINQDIEYFYGIGMDPDVINTKTRDYREKRRSAALELERPCEESNLVFPLKYRKELIFCVSKEKMENPFEIIRFDNARKIFSNSFQRFENYQAILDYNNTILEDNSNSSFNDRIISKDTESMEGEGNKNEKDSLRLGTVSVPGNLVAQNVSKLKTSVTEQMEMWDYSKNLFVHENDSNLNVESNEADKYVVNIIAVFSKVPKMRKRETLLKSGLNKSKKREWRTNILFNFNKINWIPKFPWKSAEKDGMFPIRVLLDYPLKLVIGKDKMVFATIKFGLYNRSPFNFLKWKFEAYNPPSNYIIHPQIVPISFERALPRPGRKNMSSTLRNTRRIVNASSSDNSYLLDRLNIESKRKIFSQEKNHIKNRDDLNSRRTIRKIKENKSMEQDVSNDLNRPPVVYTTVKISNAPTYTDYLWFGKTSSYGLLEPEGITYFSLNVIFFRPGIYRLNNWNLSINSGLNSNLFLNYNKATKYLIVVKNESHGNS